MSLPSWEGLQFFGRELQTMLGKEPRGFIPRRCLVIENGEPQGQTLGSGVVDFSYFKIPLPVTRVPHNLGTVVIPGLVEEQRQPRSWERTLENFP